MNRFMPCRHHHPNWSEKITITFKWVVFNCAKVDTTVTDGTQLGGPRQVTRTFTAPFARANREEDYRTASTFFEVQSANSTGA